MEDILEVYTQPYDPQRPLLCMEGRAPIPAQPGQPQRVDYEYERKGVANLFMLFDPLAGQRHVEITDQRQRGEWAQVMRLVSEELFSEAEKIVVVMDNLNTHFPASFYEAFEPDEAQRLAHRFEFHFTSQAWQLAEHG